MASQSGSQWVAKIDIVNTSRTSPSLAASPESMDSFGMEIALALKVVPHC